MCLDSAGLFVVLKRCLCLLLLEMELYSVSVKTANVVGGVVAKKQM